MNPYNKFRPNQNDPDPRVPFHPPTHIQSFWAQFSAPTISSWCWYFGRVTFRWLISIYSPPRWPPTAGKVVPFFLFTHTHTHAHTHTCTHWRAKFKSVWVRDVFFFFVRDTPDLLCNLFVCTDSLLTLSVWPSLWWRPEWFILLSLTFQIAWKIHQSPD